MCRDLEPPFLPGVRSPVKPAVPTDEPRPGASCSFSRQPEPPAPRRSGERILARQPEKPDTAPVAHVAVGELLVPDRLDQGVEDLAAELEPARGARRDRPCAAPARPASASARQRSSGWSSSRAMPSASRTARSAAPRSSASTASAWSRSAIARSGWKLCFAASSCASAARTSARVAVARDAGRDRPARAAPARARPGRRCRARISSAASSSARAGRSSPRIRWLLARASLAKAMRRGSSRSAASDTSRRALRSVSAALPRIA